MLGCSVETLVVKTGSWATAVRVGRGVDEAGIGVIGVLNCGRNEVLVGDGTDERLGAGPEPFVGGKEVGVVNEGCGMGVRGCRR